MELRHTATDGTRTATVASLYCQRSADWRLKQRGVNKPRPVSLHGGGRPAAHLTACWPDPAVLQTRRRTLVEPPWLRYSEDSVPDEGSFRAPGPGAEV